MLAAARLAGAVTGSAIGVGVVVRECSAPMRLAHLLARFLSTLAHLAGAATGSAAGVVLVAREIFASQGWKISA